MRQTDSSRARRGAGLAGRLLLVSATLVVALATWAALLAALVAAWAPGAVPLAVAALVLAGVLIPGLPLGAALALAYVKPVRRTLRALVDALGRLERGEPGGRLEVATGDELEEVAAACQRVLDRAAGGAGEAREED